MTNQKTTVAVVTNMDTGNYGSCLQAFALQHKLNELGAGSYVVKKSGKKNPWYIKLRNVFFKTGNKYSRKDKRAIKNARKAFREKNRKLAVFCEKNISMRLCSSLKGAEMAAGDADILLAGSDQIWSPVAGLLSDFTLLNFGPDYLKRYAYAASVGTAVLDPKSEALMKKNLSRFDGITLRESSSVPLIQSLTEKPVCETVDPTLLYDAAFWNQYTADRIETEPYIFVYMLRPEPVTMQAARALAKKTGCKICLFSNRILEEPGVKNITDAGIEEFLGYIKHADYIVTNSFHGTAFSVQFRKQFVSVAISGSGMRVKDFLGGIGLEGRIISSDADVERVFNEIDWNKSEQLVQMQREGSEEYLKKLIASNMRPDPKQAPLFRGKTECCGCAACKNICPKGAITLVPDEAGFMYPKVNAELCIHCGLCKLVCTYQKGLPASEVRTAYAAAAREEGVRLGSASGGAFAALAKAFLQNGGVVFGCEMQNRDCGLTPAHVFIESEDELYRLQTSKYAQSDIGDAYRCAKKFLDAGRQVLFSGTPCQIGGLRGYLRGKSYENLYMVDIICHGVPSAQLLQAWQHYLEGQKKIKIDNINFRDKKYGWGVRGTITYHTDAADSAQLGFDPYNSSFYSLYLKAAFYRENCYSCPYANVNHRPGDLTLGDFWGIDSQHPELLSEGEWKMKQGISCVLVNSEQGERLMCEYGEALDYRLSNLDKVTFGNKMLLRPSGYKGMREVVLRRYAEGGYRAVDRWFRRKFGPRAFIIGRWEKIPKEKRNKLKKLKRLILRR